MVATVLAVIPESAAKTGCRGALVGDKGTLLNWPGDRVDIALDVEFEIATNAASGGISKGIYPPIEEDDLRWQQQEAERRSVSRRTFVTDSSGRRVVSGGIDVRYEANRGCQSFRYHVAGKTRGEYPCQAYGAPIGIALNQGSARWVYHEIAD
jgi:hypothetical protein